MQMCGFNRTLESVGDNMKQIKRIIILTMTGAMLFGGPTLQIMATSTAVGEQQAVLSDDNSLSSLSLSEGELTPGLQAGRTKYTAVVSNEVTEVQVTAKPSNAKAQIVSISGNTGLSEGENVISIVVKAENGTEATYKITLTRESVATAEEDGNLEEAPEAMPISETDTVDITGDDAALDGNQQAGSVTLEEYEAMQQEYDELNEKYTELKEHDRNMMFGLSGACVVLAVICLVLFLQKRKFSEDEDFFEEDEDYYEEESYAEESYGDESFDEDESYDDDDYEEDFSEEEDESYEDEAYEDESYEEEEYSEDEEDEYEYEDATDLSQEESDETDEESDEEDYDETYDEEFDEEEIEETPRKKGRQSKRRRVKREKTEDELEVIDLNDL